MLGNLLIGPEKFVLFIGEYHPNSWRINTFPPKSSNHNLKIISDENSYEPVAQKLLHRILNGSPIYHCPKKADFPLGEANLSIDLDKETNAVPLKSNIILPNISKLEMNYSIRDIVQLIDKLKKSQNVKQCFGWIAAKQIRDGKIKPFLEYMADIVVTIQDEHTLNVLTKRITGSVFKKVNLHYTNFYTIFLGKMIDKNKVFLILSGISIRNQR